MDQRTYKPYLIKLLIGIALLVDNPASADIRLCSAGGVTFNTNNANDLCRDKRPPGLQTGALPPLSEFECRKRRDYGCEKAVVNGVDQFFCCPQVCDDPAKTQIQIGTDPKCINRVCTSDPNKVCKLVSTGDEYCCPKPAPNPFAPPTNPNAVPSNAMTNCEDKLPDCAARADLCIIVETFEMMFRDCPKTCNVCGGDCKDLGTDCPARKLGGYCERAAYFDLMTWQCTMSCNRCNNRPPPTGSLLSRRGGRR